MIFSGATKQVARYLTPRPGNPIWTSEYAHVIYLEVYTSIWDALPKKNQYSVQLDHFYGGDMYTPLTDFFSALL